MGQYLFAVVCAAIVASLSISVVDNKSAASSLVKVISGLFVVITMIAPFRKFSFIDIADYLESVKINASAAIAYGEQSSKNELIACIEEQTESYILDKASALGLDISVQVFVSGDATPIPNRVVIKGHAAPYARIELHNVISGELGIAEANISWN